ncbi:MAG: alpha/beta hydrolase [Desulfuromonadales bacterium]|nr:alpha/beta hydrolase [Desulfuromonadales bacterium]MBN2792455.1 alpha/beta hydrolase [Desulfuromonadales bacterium]
MKRAKFIQAYLNATPLPFDNIQEARRMERQRSAMAARIPFSGTIDDISADTGRGHSAIRIYTPEGSGPFPVILYMHGGGFSLGSPDTADNLCRALATASKAVIISADYQLAPEHKFPSALEECYRLALWIDAHDVALNIRNDQLVIAGDSAGGNLAAALCLLARERQEFLPAYQILICPLLDQSTPFAEKLATIRDSLLTAENMQTFSTYYLENPREGVNPLASPLLAEHLQNLPPATVVTAGLDPLCAEALMYIHRLRQVGVSVSHHHYAEQVHDFVLFIKALEDARSAVELMAGDLARSFSLEKAGLDSQTGPG